MKTIEEAAKEYADNAMLIDASVFDLREFAVIDFKSGVEFAQRWIPIEEELPSNEQEIICKNDVYKEVHTFYKNGIFDENELKLHFTHWRPIELK